jgi:hypothetical protein
MWQLSFPATWASDEVREGTEIITDRVRNRQIDNHVVMRSTACVLAPRRDGLPPHI